jgi:hypothetical protein
MIFLLSNAFWNCFTIAAGVNYHANNACFGLNTGGGIGFLGAKALNPQNINPQELLKKGDVKRQDINTNGRYGFGRGMGGYNGHNNALTPQNIITQQPSNNNQITEQKVAPHQKITEQKVSEPQEVKAQEVIPAVQNQHNKNYK